MAGLQKYSADKARRYSSIPKYQVYNNTLHSAYNEAGFEESRTNPKLWGRWVESGVSPWAPAEYRLRSSCSQILTRFSRISGKVAEIDGIFIGKTDKRMYFRVGKTDKIV